MRVLYTCCVRPFARPGCVMTTTLRVNAQELHVSTTVEENARDAPACGSRAASSKPTVACAWEKLHPLFRRAGSIEVPLSPPRRAGVEHWDGAVLCVSVDPVLPGCVV